MVEQTKMMVPPIRFKGFFDDWEKKELGDVLTERKVLQKISDDAPILAFASGQGVIDRSERRSNNRDHLTRDQANKIYKLTEYDDIVYNPSNLKYGAIDRNKHGRGVISPIYVTFITEEESSFIELIVKSEKFKLKALLYEEGTVVKRQSVKPENLLSLNIYITPNLEEQAQIGKLFQKIDQMIGLHQRKHEKLVTLKKAMLKKMFPVPGAINPEIRFKDFSKNWEERKLGDIGVFHRGISYNSNNVCDTGLLVLRSSNIQNSKLILNSDLQFIDLKCPEEIMLRKGDIAICMSNGSKALVGKSALCDINLANPTTVGAFCSIFRSENQISPYLIQTDTYLKYLRELLAGSGINNLKNSDLCELVFSIATEPAEQQKIGMYFRQLDELIDQHGTQMKKLKQIKAACLEEMFV